MNQSVYKRRKNNVKKDKTLRFFAVLLGFRTADRMRLHTHWEHVSTEVPLKSFYVLCISSQEASILPRFPIYSVHFLDGPI